ncbi:MAG: hypothetical protein VB878_21635, partial [Pirellulaceae bacterium]
MKRSIGVRCRFSRETLDRPVFADGNLLHRHWGGGAVELARSHKSLARVLTPILQRSKVAVPR